MQLKSSLAISVAIAQVATLVSAGDLSTYWQSFTSEINPKNFTAIPVIAQTTSLNPTTECKYYNPDTSLINIVDSEWPSIWETATTNGMNTSAEFVTLYNSIDWASAPDIPVRTFDSDGNLDYSNYNASDPDCWWTFDTCTTPKLPGVNQDISNCPEPETWGLTYDDGPNCSHNAFYDYLQEQKLSATMFYIGSNVIDWPYGAMRGLLDGHHIGCHTWSHQYTTSLTNQEVLAELYYTQKAIHLATGLTPRYWRPPYGDVDDRVRWIATQLGLTAVIWNLDTNDWAAGYTTTVQDVQQTYDDYITMGTNGTFATSGNIVLTHEINNTTMTLAIENLPKIMSAYKQVLDVATCYNISYPYFEDYEWTNVLNASTSASSPATTTNISLSSSPSSSAATFSGAAVATATAAKVNAAATSGTSNVVPNVTLVIAFIAAVLF